MEWDDGILVRLDRVINTDQGFLLCQRVRPLSLEGIAGVSIVCRVVTRRADGNGCNQLATDSGVELRPSLLGRPSGVTREHMAVRIGSLARRCQYGHGGELREKEAVHHFAESLEMLGIVVAVHIEAVRGPYIVLKCSLFSFSQIATNYGIVSTGPSVHVNHSGGGP